MILYTEKARESWKGAIAAARKNVCAIPGNYLSYNESGEIMRLLSLLEDYINAESRADSGKR